MVEKKSKPFVEADTLEEAHKMALEMYSNNAVNVEENPGAYTECLEETAERMTVLDNDGCATEELYLDGDFLADNVAEDPFDQDYLSTKEIDEDNPAFDHIRDE